MSTDLMMRSEINYRSARIKDSVRRTRQVNRFRHPRTPADRVA